MRLWAFSSSACEREEKLRSTSGRTLPALITRHAVELVRDKGKRDAIGPVEVPKHLEERPAESGMPGWIGRKRRGKIRPREIAGRRPERREGRVSDGGRIAVAQAARTVRSSASRMPVTGRQYW